jgi:hypothetical protein
MEEEHEGKNPKRLQKLEKAENRFPLELQKRMEPC